MDGYSYELSPDDLTVGGYNLAIRDAIGNDVAVTFFIAPDMETAEKVAKVGFESGDWKHASDEGYTRSVMIDD